MYIIIQIKNIPAICEAIILFDVFHKRKAYIDAIAEGLEMFKMKTAISIFPEVFKDLFIKQSHMCLSSKIIKSLNFGTCGLREKEKLIEGLIKKAIEGMSNAGIMISYLYVYTVEPV